MGCLGAGEVRKASGLGGQRRTGQGAGGRSSEPGRGGGQVGAGGRNFGGFGSLRTGIRGRSGGWLRGGGVGGGGRAGEHRFSCLGFGTGLGHERLRCSGRTARSSPWSLSE